MTLDKQRPYGQIYGDLEEYPSALYYQDGRYFGASGDEILSNTEPVAIKLKKPSAPLRVKDPIMELVIGDGEE